MDPIQFPSSSSSNSSSDSDDTNFAMMNANFLADDPMFFPIVAVLENEGTSQQRPRKRRVERPRLILEGAAKLQRDYFDGEGVYPNDVFRQRFRMDKELFVRMADEVIEKNHYFRQKYDVASRPEPNAEDIRQLNIINTRRGFSGMLRSIDCMHWRWKNCPTAWTGQYQSGHNKESSIVLQAVASKNLWICHAYFGASGCNNDINVLEESDLFDRLLEGDAPLCSYKVKGIQYNMCYYLDDAIYPPWACFVKSIPSPQSQKDCTFSRYQEAVRKDAERAFGVLQSRWHILRGSARLWYQEDLKYIMLACIILHNMIVEREPPEQLESRDFPMADSDDPPPPLPIIENPPPTTFR